MEELYNERSPTFGKAIMHGGVVALEGMVNFGTGGTIGSVGNIGKKDRFFTSKEWWGKIAFGWEFTKPLNVGFDLLRNNID